MALPPDGNSKTEGNNDGLWVKPLHCWGYRLARNDIIIDKYEVSIFIHRP